jgi:LysR family glycine cleavage system transcriptional activator
LAIPRRHLPSVSGLCALEAFERLGSVSAVAAELDLTQSAVSRQLQILEDQIGIGLFLRERNRLHLTWHGAEYAREVRGALKVISSASLRLKANPQGGAFNLAILPTFGIRWLTPRLGSFVQRHPEVTIHLSTRIVPFDFGQERFDAAIHHGGDDWPGTQNIKLMDETVVPVGSPRLLARARIRSVEDVLAQPLLQIETRPRAWEHWAGQHGVTAGRLGGMTFDQFSNIAQATEAGLGLSLLPEFMIQNELRDGRLAVAFGKATASIGAYFLVWPKARADYPPLVSFRTWLAEQARAAAG